MADDPTPPPAERLDPTEVDRLLVPTVPEAGGKSLLIRADGAKSDPAALARVAPYDFRNPVFLSELELRRLRQQHEDFIRYLSARLALYLRMEFSLKLASLTTVTYTKFTEALPNPTHLSLFKLEPLVGVGILDVSPRLALSFADRLLGGRGHSVKAERCLTEIEIALVEDVITILLEEWCGLWRLEQELKPLIIGHESNGRFLQTSPKDAIIIALTLEATFGDCTEQIQLGIPYYTIEPVVKKMQVRRQKDATVAPAEKRSAWQPAYDRITVPLRAEWQALELSLREVATLRVGDVVEMPASIFNETRVLINGTPVFNGTVGLDTERVAVQLTRKLPLGETHHVKPDGR